MSYPVPDGVSGEWRIESFRVSEADSKFTRIRAILHPDEYVPPGLYKRLMRGNTVVMSNTPMEERTNRSIIRRATGRVLINGLGMGMVPIALMTRPKPKNEWQLKPPTEIWIVEKSADVIALVGPTVTADPRVKLIHDDAFTWQPPKGVRFDRVWSDIWDNITSDNLPEMTRLKRKYGRRCDWHACWAETECRRMR